MTFFELQCFYLKSIQFPLRLTKFVNKDRNEIYVVVHDYITTFLF